MREVDARCGHAVRQRQIGSIRPVLWERAEQETTRTGWLVWSGLTDNYLRVQALVPESVNLRNHITPVRLTRLDGNVLWGEIIHEPDLLHILPDHSRAGSR